MQHALNTMTTSLLPQELFDLARAHEYQEVQRHRLLTLRFLPFSAGISRLMDMLLLESEQRLEALTQAAERLALAAPITAPDREGQPRDQHFFIINQRMATQALTQAVIDEHQSLRYYRQLREANATPQLHTLLAGCVDQKLAQGRVLQESQDQLLTVDAWSGYCRSA